MMRVQSCSVLRGSDECLNTAILFATTHLVHRNSRAVNASPQSSDDSADNQVRQGKGRRLEGSADDNEGHCKLLSG